MARFNFDLEVERNGGRARVAVRGELDLGTAARLERCLAELLGSGEPVLLDLRELTFMDSTGLCALLKAREQAEAHDWALAMVRPRGQALTTLRQSGAERLLPFEEPGE
jgi:anti-sigma B factor antagonist